MKSLNISKEEMHAMRERHAMVAAKEREELRAMTPDEKFKQVQELLNTANAMCWDLSKDKDEEKVRKRWARLHEAMRGRE